MLWRWLTLKDKKINERVVFWRAFVYGKQDMDRAMQSFDMFAPLDKNASFSDSVIVQIKNGPMDFQVREPVSPLFGYLKNTNFLLEVQVTQEYTGQQIHVVGLWEQWKYYLEFEVRPGVKL